MSDLLRWTMSPEWAQAVRALLHTLWQGAIIVLVLAVVLRGVGSPVNRYRCALTALAGLLLAGIVTWSVLVNQSKDLRSAPAVPSFASPGQLSAPSGAAVSVIGVAARQSEARPAAPWTAWLAPLFHSAAPHHPGDQRDVGDRQNPHQHRDPPRRPGRAGLVELALPLLPPQSHRFPLNQA